MSTEKENARTATEVIRCVVVIESYWTREALTGGWLLRQSASTCHETQSLPTTRHTSYSGKSEMIRKIQNGLPGRRHHQQRSSCLPEPADSSAGLDSCFENKDAISKSVASVWLSRDHCDTLSDAFTVHLEMRPYFCQ